MLHHHGLGLGQWVSDLFLHGSACDLDHRVKKHQLTSATSAGLSERRKNHLMKERETRRFNVCLV